LAAARLCLLLGLRRRLAGGPLRLLFGVIRLPPLPRCLALLGHRSGHASAAREPEPEWARNVLVGANSPSLWPTIDSEMNTGTCLRPSCTAIVCPTISGKIVEVPDQVRTICLLPDAFIASIRDISRSSTNGPFLLERLIACLSLFSVRARC